MPPIDASSASQAQPDRRSGPGDLSVPQLAHELNSLLDGSLRYVSLALRLLEELEATGTDGSGRPVSNKLQRAQGAMVQMADLLERVMRRDDPSVGVLARRDTIDQELRWLGEMVEPLAAAEGVGIEIKVAPEVATRPVGPLGTVLLNGLRNAVQACARAPGGGERRVEVSVTLADPQTVSVVITDTGPGPPAGVTTPAGHGLGMALSRQILETLGGSLELAAGPARRGSALRVRVPLAALSEPWS